MVGLYTGGLILMRRGGGGAYTFVGLIVGGLRYSDFFKLSKIVHLLV